MATILIPLPAADFDPTESAVPSRILSAAGHVPVFATPDGKMGQADARMLTGKGLGIFAPLLRADANGRQAYAAMQRAPAFRKPIAWDDIRSADFQALLLPGGHAPGMRPYLESVLLQERCVEFFEQAKPVGTICHGVLLAARSCTAGGRSVLFGRKTTALTRRMELGAWVLTCSWLGNYYRTYARTVQGEISGLLAAPDDFITGPGSLRRDSPHDLEAGFTVADGRYLSARWPGDAHRFATEFAALCRA
ncbi:MAG TPA: type 1 glutamine amidotransferase domain-containing protein [Burkholderiaceae bacterium]|nr:type 1 glutamine amidotransferase domain-containing protein [Burkholderiaceae bacterium]